MGIKELQKLLRVSSERFDQGTLQTALPIRKRGGLTTVPVRKG